MFGLNLFTVSMPDLPRPNLFPALSSLHAATLFDVQVTNTPWGGKVVFAFDPAGDAVPKCLHVSPFMAMGSTWRLTAPAPGAQLLLRVKVEDPEHGPFFSAVLKVRPGPRADRKKGQ